MAFKINWVGIREALDPLYGARRYTVHYGGYHTGRFEVFWLRSSAEKFYAQVESYPFVDLIDNFICPEKQWSWSSDGSNPTRLKFKEPPQGPVRIYYTNGGKQ